MSWTAFVSLKLPKSWIERHIVGKGEFAENAKGKRLVKLTVIVYIMLKTVKDVIERKKKELGTIYLCVTLLDQCPFIYIFIYLFIFIIVFFFIIRLVSLSIRVLVFSNVISAFSDENPLLLSSVSVPPTVQCKPVSTTYTVRYVLICTTGYASRINHILSSINHAFS